MTDLPNIASAEQAEDPGGIAQKGRILRVRDAATRKSSQ